MKDEGEALKAGEDLVRERSRHGRVSVPSQEVTGRGGVTVRLLEEVEFIYPGKK